MFYWILLALAIIDEITDRLSIKQAGISGSDTGFILMLIMIVLAYIFLAFAVKKLPVWSPGLSRLNRVCRKR